jgi:hypothetical protein
MSMVTVAAVGTLAVTAAGTGYSMYQQNKASKAAKAGAGMSGYNDPNYAQNMGNDQLSFAKEFTKAGMDLYPQLAGMERVATSNQRRRDLGDLNRLGPGYMNAMQRIAPGFGQAIGYLNGQVAQAGKPTALEGQMVAEAQNAGPSAIRENLDGQAIYDLQLGRMLSPEEIRASQQQARSAFADRGLAFSNPAIAAEILNRDAYATQREAQRRQFAMGVQQMGMGEDAANHQFQLGVNQNLMQRTNADRGFGISALGAQQATLAPVLGILGQRAAVPVQTGVSMLASAPSIMGAGADQASTLYNAAQAQQIAAQNRNDALLGAGINAAGQIGSSYLSSYGSGASSSSATGTGAGLSQYYAKPSTSYQTSPNPNYQF